MNWSVMGMVAAEADIVMPTEVAVAAIKEKSKIIFRPLKGLITGVSYY
jgi:hypothetical protein